MGEPRRLGIYARVSTQEQAREDATSIEKQQTAGRLEANRLAQFGAVEIVKTYCDEGASGAVSMKERPEGARAMADARRGKLDTLVCFSMDRFTRSASKGLTDFEALEAAGVEVIFIKENIDTSQPSGRLFRTILAGFAEFEREQIRDRTMGASYARAKKGIWATGAIPYGYQIDDKGKIVLHPIEAPVVKTIYQMRANGSSLRQISAELDSMQQTTRKGNRWTHKQVSRVLYSDKYDGKMVRLFAASGSSEPEAFIFYAPLIMPAKLHDAAKSTVAGGVEERMTLTD